MGTARRKPGTPLVEALEDESYSFDFYQAVRVLEAMRPGTESLGRSPYVRNEAVRLRSAISLAFPASEISQVTVSDSEKKPSEIEVTFMGIAGLQGPLPRVYTELIMREVSRKSFAFRDFLDIFNHRLLSLFYRTREKHRPGARIQEPHEGRVAQWLFSVAGLGTSGLRQRMRGTEGVSGGLQDRALLPFAGLLAMGPRSAVGLEQIMTEYFHQPVQVRQFVGTWRELSPGQWTKLGTRKGANHRLGDDAVLGRRVWDQDGALVVEIGPLPMDAFLRFLPAATGEGLRVPEGDAYAPARRLVSFYAGADRDARVQLRLRRDEVPHTTLTADASAPRLGYTSWLTTGPLEGEPDPVSVN